MARSQTRSKWRMVFSPGWLLTVAIALAFTYLAFTVLAPWQLGKNDAVQARNDRIRVAEKLDPVALSSLYSPGTALDAQEEYRQVQLAGQFTDDVIVLRNRPVGGVPAYQVLGVFQGLDGTQYLIHRGWQTVSNARTIDNPEIPRGEVTITARLRQPEPVPTGAGQPFEDGTMWQVYGISPEQISGLINRPLQPLFLQLTDDSVGVDGRAYPLPDLDDGPYLSYGVQWIGFGLLVPIGVGYFIYNEIRERRRDAELAGAPANAAEPAAPPAPTPAAAPADPATTTPSEPTSGVAVAPADDEATRRAAKLAQRYGRS